MDCVSPSSALSFPLLPFCLPLYTICWLALASSSSTALAWRWPDTPSPSAEAPPIFARFSCFPSAHKARASLIVPPYVSHSHAFAKRSPAETHLRQKCTFTRIVPGSPPPSSRCRLSLPPPRRTSRAVLRRTVDVRRALVPSAAWDRATRATRATSDLPRPPCASIILSSL